MSALATQPVRSTPPSASRRSAHALDEGKPAWLAGVAGALLAHALLALLVFSLPGKLLRLENVSEKPLENRTFEIQLSPELFAPATPPPLEPPRFVEVNPAAPENVPDKAPFVGAQNQQVAQPVPTPEGANDTPEVKGDDEKNSTAIVSGLSKEPPQPSASEILAQAFKSPKPAPEEMEPEEKSATKPAARAVNSPPGGEQLLGPADGDAGSTVTKLPPVPGAAEGAEARPGTAAGRAQSGGYFNGSPRIDRTRPQDRPRLTEATVNARSTPTIKNEFGTKNIGVAAYNAKWSAYGEYLQRLIDAVQTQWERLLLRSAFYPTSGATVRVVFKLNSAGEVSDIGKVDGSGGELAQRLCVSAITERAPYGEWTDDMTAVLGKEQELTFTFHYQ